MRRCLAVALLVLSSPAWAEDKVEIQHNPAMNPGDKSQVRVETNIEQTLTIAGTPLHSKVEQFMAIDEEVGEPDGDGGATTRDHFEFMIFRMTLPDGREFNFDSGNPDQSSGIAELEPIEKLFRALSGVTWTSTFDADHKMVSLEYDGDPFSQLDEAMRKEVATEKWLQRSKIDLARLPDGAVAVGDTWTRTEPMDLGSGQTMTFEKKYEYLGTQETGGVVFDRIGSSALSVEYRMEANPNLPIDVKESDLTVESSGGELLYNRERQIVTSTTQNCHITGPMTLVLNGQELPGELDLTMSFSTTVEPAP